MIWHARRPLTVKQVRARQAEPSLERVEVELRDQDAVAVSDDLAARDLRLVGDDRLELLLADPVGDELRRLLALLRRLEETERAEDAVAGLDEEVAREPGHLLQLRDERLVDFAGQLGRSILIHTVVTSNGRMHVLLLPSIVQDREHWMNSMQRSGRLYQSKRKARSLNGFKANQRAQRTIARLPGRARR